jgi:uncharacterized protein (DUF433 family)
MVLLERLWQERGGRALFEDDCGPVSNESDNRRISFRLLSALFVYSAVFRSFISEIRLPWRHPEDLYCFVRLFHEVSLTIVDDPQVLIDPEWVLNRFGRTAGRLAEMDRTRLLKLITLHQTRVEMKDGIPVRLFPFSRDPGPDAPRVIVIDPDIRFGRPTVKGAPTDVLAERWRAGDSSPELAEDYGLTPDEIDEALRFESLTPNAILLFPFRPLAW